MIFEVSIIQKRNIKICNAMQKEVKEIEDYMYKRIKELTVANTLSISNCPIIFKGIDIKGTNFKLSH